MILRLGMMHTLMSFTVSVGKLKKSTSVQELLGASFGCLTPIFDGIAWSKALQAFCMVMPALLHDFLEEGEKS